MNGCWHCNPAITKPSLMPLGAMCDECIMLEKMSKEEIVVELPDTGEFL